MSKLNLRLNGGERSPRGAVIRPDGVAWCWRCRTCPEFGRTTSRAAAIAAWRQHLPAGEEDAKAHTTEAVW